MQKELSILYTRISKKSNSKKVTKKCHFCHLFVKTLLLINILSYSVLPAFGQYLEDSVSIAVGDIRSGEEAAAFKVDYTINPEVKAKPVKADGMVDDIAEGGDYTLARGENGKYTFVLTDSEGNEHKVESDVMPATIEDKEGNTYEVNEKGEVKAISKTSDIQLNPATKHTQSSIAKLSFRATANTKYAVDEYNEIYQKVTEYNDQYTLEGTSLPGSAKFMLPGTSDEVEVYIKENKDNGLIPDKVHFITGDGKEYESKYDAGSRTWTLTVVAGNVNDGQEVYAVQDMGGGKTETLAKLNIFTYEPVSRSVTLVPVNGAMNGLTKENVEQGLNEIYGKIGVSWTVNVAEPFSYTPKNGSAFNVTGSGLLSMFTDDMKAINEAFKGSGEYQEDGLYLFVLPFEASEGGTDGDMPLGSQFGYLFAGAGDRTIAHEVGHGAFNLEHPFDRPGRNSFEKGALKDNLMDYTAGTGFAKIQWDATRAPGHVIGLFQKDRGGMAAIITQNALEKLEQFKNDDGSYTFVSLSGKPITIANSSKKEVLSEVIFNTYEDKFTDGTYNNVFGALTGFKFTDGREYRAAKVSGTKSFTGYIQTNGDGDKAAYYVDEITAKKEYKYVLAGFPSIKNRNIVFNVFPVKSPNNRSFRDYFNVDKINVDSNNKGDGVIQETFFLATELNSYVAHQRTEGKDYIEIYAQLNLSDIQKEFIGSLGENIIGSEALYAYAIADLITEGGISSPCMFDARNLKDLQDQKMGEFLFSVKGYLGLYSQAPDYSVNPHTTKLERTYAILNNWAVLSKHILSKDITEESINTILSLLDNFDSDEGRTCFMRSLNIDIRKAILEKSSQWTVTSNKEALLANLVATTPVADIETMLSFLKNDNYKIYWKLYNEINASNAEVYIGAVTQLLKNSKVSQNETTDITLYVNKDLHVNTLIAGASIQFAKEDNGSITFYPNGGTLFNDGERIEVIKTGQLEPFDFVRVKFLEDFRFTNVNSTNQSDPRIKKGEEVLVPALWIYGIVDRQTTVKNFTIVRVVADICAVAASVTTAQPEIFIIVDAAIAGVDIVAAVAEDKIMSSGSEDMRQLIDTWNTVGVAWGGTVLTRAAGYMAINRVELWNYFKTSAKGNIQKTKEFFNQFNRLYEEIRANGASNSFLNHLDDIRYTIQIQAKITYTQKASVLVDETQYSLQQGGKLVVSRNNRDHYLGKIIVDDGKNLTGLDDIQWYNRTNHGDVSESLNIIDDIEYLPQSSSIKTKGDLEVVIAKNGSVYLRISNKIEVNKNIDVIYDRGLVSVTLKDNPNFVVGEADVMDGMLSLHIDVKNGVNNNLPAPANIRGEEVFDAIYNKFREIDEIEDIVGIRAQWVAQDNLATFNKLILEEVNMGRMTIEEAALSTFTGKMAIKLGFTKVSGIRNPDNLDGTYKFVYVNFTKP